MTYNRPLLSEMMRFWFRVNIVQTTKKVQVPACCYQSFSHGCSLNYLTSQEENSACYSPESCSGNYLMAHLIPSQCAALAPVPCSIPCSSNSSLPCCRAVNSSSFLWIPLDCFGFLRIPPNSSFQMFSKQEIAA